MEMYDIEALHVKQRKMVQEICEYVCGEALKNDLFRYVLKMGHTFLNEVIARHGTGKVEGPGKPSTFKLRPVWLENR